MNWLVATVVSSGLVAGEPQEPGLVAHYRFAAGRGEWLRDASGHGHDGRIAEARWEQAAGRGGLRFDAGGGYVDCGDNRALKPSGDFTLLGVVRQGPRARLIVDGVSDAEFACGGDPIYGSVPFRISSPSQPFAGLIHEARIYDRALSAGEIAAEYWREAERVGKDVTRQGQLRLRGSVYADDPQVLAEVDFLGVLPLADGERAVVSLVRGDGATIGDQAADPIPDTCQGEFAFDLTGQAVGEYALSAVVRGPNGHSRAAVRDVFHVAGHLCRQGPVATDVRRAGAAGPPTATADAGRGPARRRLLRGGGGAAVFR